MTINIVCPGCKKRWTVNDKFAGQKGPCPSCKTVIDIPKKGDEVVVHAPEEAGPKDSKGRAVLKPILREETKFSVTTAVAIGLAVVVVLGIAVFLRTVKPLPLYVLALGAIGLAPPLVLGGYTFCETASWSPTGAGSWRSASRSAPPRMPCCGVSTSGFNGSWRSTLRSCSSCMSGRRSFWLARLRPLRAWTWIHQRADSLRPLSDRHGPFAGRGGTARVLVSFWLGIVWVAPAAPPPFLGRRWAIVSRPSSWTPSATSRKSRGWMRGGT